MDNMQDILSSVLSDPEAVQKLRSLGKELGLVDNNSSEKQNSHNKQSAPVQNAPFDLSALSGLLSPQNNGSRNSQSNQGFSLSPEIMSRISSFLPLLSGLNQDDEATALLCSLRPFLSRDKHRRLEEAEKMLRIMRLLPKLHSTGII